MTAKVAVWAERETGRKLTADERLMDIWWTSDGRHSANSALRACRADSVRGILLN